MERSSSLHGQVALRDTANPKKAKSLGLQSKLPDFPSVKDEQNSSFSGQSLNSSLTMGFSGSIKPSSNSCDSCLEGTMHCYCPTQPGFRLGSWNFQDFGQFPEQLNASSPSKILHFDSAFPPEIPYGTSVPIGTRTFQNSLFSSYDGSSDVMNWFEDAAPRSITGATYENLSHAQSSKRSGLHSGTLFSGMTGGSHGEGSSKSTAFATSCGLNDRPEISSRPSGRLSLGLYENESQEEHNSRADSPPPSLTTGSSRSAQSSVVTCEYCRGSNTRCGCQSDSESIRTWNYDAEWAPSPDRPENLTARHVKVQNSVWHSSFLSQIHAATFPKMHEHKTTGSSFSPCNDSPQSSSNCVEDASNDISPLMRRKVSQYALEDSTVYSRGGWPESQVPANLATTEDSDSKMSEDDDESQEDDDESEEDDSDNDWNGDNDSLEAITLEAVQGDLSFAARLIPILHRYIYSERMTRTVQKVSPWRYGIKSCSPGTGASNSEQSSSSNTRASDSTSSPRKRQRRMSSHSQGLEPDGDDDDENGNGNGNGRRDPKGFDGIAHDIDSQELPRLACPFNKRDPTYYGIHHGLAKNLTKTDYRACAGPGFNSIQRLKEHLKRKHYPVQCDRCCEIFRGSDRAKCVAALESHRQRPIPCELKIPSRKEGISDAQWANLDKKKSTKKTQETSRVEKWMEIWVILFPDIPKPATPWYEENNPRMRLPSPSQESERFAHLFKTMLDLQVGQKHIRFIPGEEEEMKDKVESLVQKTFALFLGVNGATSLTDSSSARSRRDLSYLRGSFAYISNPTATAGQSSTSGSRSTADRSQGTSLTEVSGMPTAGEMVPPARRESMIGPFTIGMQHIVGDNFLQTYGTEPPFRDYHDSSMDHLGQVINDYPDSDQPETG